jgi:hypothetical protein
VHAPVLLGRPQLELLWAFGTPDVQTAR